jgi:DNA repair protein RadC
MAKYKVPTEEFILVGDEVYSNPDRPTYLDYIEIPMGKFADLKVRIALVRNEEYGKYEDFTIGQSSDVHRLMQTIDTESQETLSVVLLDARNNVIGVHEVVRGGITKAAFEIKLLFQSAVISNAVSLILVHNHPSGNVKPSDEDIALTEEVSKASAILGYKLLDHVIIGSKGKFTSLADEGLI